jgi:hypothetical protein
MDSAFLTTALFIGINGNNPKTASNAALLEIDKQV